MLYNLFCILQDILDSLHLLTHIPILLILIRQRIYNHNVVIPQSETLETAFGSI